jgi:hypothetical protein
LIEIFNGREKGKKNPRIWWMRSLRLLLVAGALILPPLLLVHLLNDDKVFSWHGLAIQGKHVDAHIFGLKKIPTLCGLYVCLFVWTTGIYMIVSGVFEGILWIWFIYRVTREPLGIVPHHPDLCGGLHYFKYSVFAWSALIIAVGVLVALDTANYLGMAPTKEVKKEIFVRWDIFLKRILYIFGGFSIFLFPMVPVACQMFDKKVEAQKEAGNLAEEYMNYFQGLLDKDKPSYNQFKGTGGPHEAVEDLSYLFNYFKNLDDMKIWPLDFGGALKMAATVLGPLSIILIPEAREYLKNLVS